MKVLGLGFGRIVVKDRATFVGVVLEVWGKFRVTIW